MKTVIIRNEQGQPLTIHAAVAEAFHIPNGGQVDNAMYDAIFIADCHFGIAECNKQLEAQATKH